MGIIDIDHLLLITEGMDIETVGHRIHIFDIDQLLEKTDDW